MLPKHFNFTMIYKGEEFFLHFTNEIFGTGKKMKRRIITTYVTILSGFAHSLMKKSYQLVTAFINLLLPLYREYFRSLSNTCLRTKPIQLKLSIKPRHFMIDSSMGPLFLIL